MSKDVTLEGKSLQDVAQERFRQAAQIADQEAPDVGVKKPLKEEHFHKLYFFKTEHDKLQASMQMLRSELQKYGQDLIKEYFPGETDAIISLEERSIGLKSKIEKVETKLELPK